MGGHKIAPDNGLSSTLLLPGVAHAFRLAPVPSRLVILGVGLKSRAFLRGYSGYIWVMSIEEIAAEALRLPPKERAMLAESLWESLMDPFKVPTGGEDSDVIALATERDRQLESGEVQPVSHEEMMSRLRR